MAMKDCYKIDFSKIENPCVDFILSRSGIKNMKDFLLNNIFSENMTDLRVFVMPPIF